MPKTRHHIWDDDDPHGEGGMLSLASLFVIVGLMVLFSALSNIGKLVAVKLETQNAADSVAYSAGVELARGMNGVTATNHLIGELQALCVLHHAFGGDPLDGRGSARRTPADVAQSLQLSYSLARTFSVGGPPPYPFMYNQVRKELRTGAAIADARIRLKQVMTWAYVTHAVGGLFLQLRWIPYVGPIFAAIGTAIMYIAISFEAKVYLEWLTLDGLEFGARIISPIKRAVASVAIPGLNLYSRTLEYQAAYKAEKAAEGVAAGNAADWSLFPGLKKATSLPPLRLPVTPEPATLRFPARSQLVRASTPWVQHWRTPILRFAEKGMLLARFKSYYLARTDEYTISLATRQKRENGVNLLVLRGLEIDGQDKTHEKWSYADHSRDADKLFCVVGFARRGRSPMNSFRIFRQPNPDGVAAYAQAMVYNANPQRRAGAGGRNQRAAGWDTLNWENAVPEFRRVDTRGDPAVPSVPKPRIRVNWRVKLVPTTRLAESVWWQDGDLGRVLRRTPWYHTPLGGAH